MVRQTLLGSLVPDTFTFRQTTLFLSSMTMAFFSLFSKSIFFSDSEITAHPETRKNVMEIHHSARDEAFKGREGMILKEREQLEDEMQNQSEMLQQDFASAKQRFNELTKQLSSQVSERLLN
jgi:hypothetical protein